MAWPFTNKEENNQRIIINELKETVFKLNAQTLNMRDILSNGLGISHDGKRNIYDVYGYPNQYQFIDGYNAIRREGIANRIVSGVAKSCWRNGFEIMLGTKNDDANKSVLDDEINKLAKLGMFNYLERSDILNRIGKFSVLFVGVADNDNFRAPLSQARGDALKTLYFRSFAYDGIEISQYNNDSNDPRFGLPELYQLSVSSRGNNEKSQRPKTLVVHYSRVVHMAENLLDDEVEGIPSIEPIYNRILDIDKATGGSSEAYFRNSRGKIAFEIDPEFSTQLLDDPIAKEAFDEAGKKFTNNWEDQVTVIGAKVTSITTPHADPSNTVKTALWAISGNTGIPIRVLTGEGGGQLAGTEDRLTYNALISDRQNHVCTQWVNRLLQILNIAGLIKLPEVFYIRYPLDEPLTEIDKADLGNKKADTLQKLTAASSNIGGDSINLKSALEAFHLDDIEIDEMDDLEDVDSFTGMPIEKIKDDELES